MQDGNKFTPPRPANKVPPVTDLRGRFSNSLLRLLLNWLLIPLFTSAAAEATLYEVGPARDHKSLQEVAPLLRPGDIVTVDGGVTYPGGVSLDANGAPGAGVITIKGTRVAGKRPILAGGFAVLRVRGSHYLIEGFDMTSGKDPGATRCFYNVGDDITLRDSVVHDCHFTGIAGSDSSGSLTLDGDEVYACGGGLYAHQIYVGSSLAKYPRAIFRMRYCYIHDGAGGNNVKSRVTRNEIEYNWIEGAAFHELDLDGPDPKAQKMPPAAHCDALIVGNVLIKRPNSQGAVARFGSDGTASSRGRYILLNNTIIVQAKPATGFGLFWLKGEVDSVAMINNAFWSEAGPMQMLRTEPGTAPGLTGNGNWTPQSTTALPASIKAIRGTDPGFVNAAAGDYRPAPGSPLIAAGCIPPGSIRTRGFPPFPNTPADPRPIRPPDRDKDIGAFPFAAPKPVQ